MARNKHAQINHVAVLQLCYANNFIQGQTRASLILFANQFIPKTLNPILMCAFRRMLHVVLLVAATKNWEVGVFSNNRGLEILLETHLTQLKVHVSF